MSRLKEAAIWPFILSIFLVSLAGCSPIVRIEQGAATQILSIHQNDSVGQTLTTNYSGLMGVEIYVDPKAAAGNQGDLVFHLRLTPTSDVDLATTSVSLRDIRQPGFYQFSFEPIARSSLTDFYFFVENTSIHPVDIAAAPGRVYLDGALYRNHQAQDSQFAFHLVYAPAELILGLAKEAAALSGALLLFAALFVLPGWALLTAAWPAFRTRTWVERAAFGCGVGLSIYPVLFLWTKLFNLHLGPLYAWAPPLVSGAYLIWYWIKSRPTLPTFRLPASIAWPDFMLVVLAALIFFVRFWVVRNLAGGMWGDSYHHTLIVQLLLDHNGLFDHWAPYADLTTFTYHFGFHTWAAVFQWISGLPAKDVVVLVGQILNSMSIFMLYPLALFLVRNRWAGLFTVLIAGLLMPVPMSYTNWGRYTQLAGQVILPCAILLLFALIEQREKRLGLLLINWLVWSALAMTHYRILILAVLIVPGYLLLMVPAKYWLDSLKQMAWLGAGAGVLFLPWFIHVFGGKIMALFFLLVQKEASPGFSPEVETMGSLSKYAPPFLWVLLVLAFTWALWQRKKPFLVFLLWWLLIVIAANPGLILMAGNDIITNFTVLIAVYMLIAPVVGAFFSNMLSWIMDRSETWTTEFRLPTLGRIPWRTGLSILAVLLIVPAASWGSIQRVRDIQPFTYSLLTRPDMRAFQWIDQNVKREARFLVNSFLAYYDSVAVGSDGGWWLALLAGRSSSIPPINSGFEQGETPHYQKWVNQMVHLVVENGVSSDAVIEEFDSRAITHVYIGQVHGEEPAKENLLIPQDLLNSAHFSLIYHQDRVWIFEVR